jgi:hypothetical protein
VLHPYINIQPPIVIIPMSQWNKMSQKGLRFALKLSPDILVVQVQEETHSRLRFQDPGRAFG